LAIAYDAGELFLLAVFDLHGFRNRRNRMGPFYCGENRLQDICINDTQPPADPLANESEKDS